MNAPTKKNIYRAADLPSPYSNLKPGYNKKIMFQPPKGTRDLLPEDMKKRRFVFEKLRQVFELYGYEEIETPAFESLELLTCKGSLGEEAVKDIYRFKDKAGRELGLRFDQTTPIARIVSSKSLPKPIRWYSISKSWRYEDVAKGRLREFYQAGIELIGSPASEADAEILQVIIDCLLSLGLKDFTVRINSRAVLDSLATRTGIKDKDAAFRILDKLDKKGEAFVKKELIKKTDKDKAAMFLDAVKKSEAKELDPIINALPEKYRKFVKTDTSIARGLDYYTGFIFEVVVKGFEDLGAIAAGGRYDSLIEKYGGPKMPATGFGIGIERLIEVLDNRIELEKKKNTYIISLSDTKKQAIAIANRLRERSVSAELALVDRSLTNQLKYAGSKGIKYVVIVGPKDLKDGKVTVRDMETGKEEKISIESLAEYFS